MRVWLGNAGFAAAGPVFAVAVLLFLPAERAGAEIWRINDVDRSVSIHLRQQPSNRSKVLAYIPVDTDGLVGDTCEGDWCPIEYKGLKGWVFSKYLIPDENAGETPATVAALPKLDGEAAAPKPDGQAAQPQAQAQAPPKILQLAPNSGPPVPVYAFPNEKLPIAGHLPAETESVERIGPCARNWCYIKSGLLIGWLRDGALAKPAAADGDTQGQTAKAEGSATAKAEAEDSKTDAANETRALNKTETTATQAATLHDQAVAQTVTESGNKLYSLAGLSGDTSLPIREQPEDSATIVAVIPSEAKNIEGLHKCTGKWCLVRHNGSTGWVQRRHLADEGAEPAQLFQVDGVALWSGLDVVDYPGEDATVVGRIPAYATGIVPIGGCDKAWCHVRYLGVAGWVSGQYLAPLSR